MLVALESTGDKAKLAPLAKQLAMYVAAANPQSLTVADLNQHPSAADAFRPAEQCQRSVAQVRQHQRRNLDEIAQQVALGDGRLARVGGSRPIDAVEMRQRDRMAVDS